MAASSFFWANDYAAVFEQIAGSAVKPGQTSAVVELVEVAHRLHDRLEIGPRVQRVEQLRGVREQPVRALQRDDDVVLRRVGEAAVTGQQNPGVQSLDAL